MNSFITDIIIFLPAGVSNMTPVLANKIPGLKHWNTPVDFGHSWGGKRIFGDHKTWRGIVTGTACGTLFGAFLGVTLLSSNYTESWLPYFLFMSFGALAGDAIKSFFKRRANVASGKSWFPFDQTDYIIGGLVFTLPFGVPSLKFVVEILAVYFVLHITVSYLGYRLHLKKDPI